MSRPYEFFAVFLQNLSAWLAGRRGPRPDELEVVHGCSRPGCRRFAALAFRGRHYCRLHRPPLAPLVEEPPERPGGTGEPRTG